jgi:hypothetical protein
MDIKEINLNDADTEKFAQLDESIRQKSVEAVSLQLRADALRHQVRDFYEFRKNLIDEKLKEHDVDLSKVVNVSLQPDGDYLAKIVAALRPDSDTPSE